MKYTKRIKITDEISLEIKESEETDIVAMRGQLALIDKILKAVDNTVGVATGMKVQKRQYTKKTSKHNVWTKDNALQFLSDLNNMSKQEVADKYNLKYKSLYTIKTKVEEKLKSGNFSNGKTGRRKKTTTIDEIETVKKLSKKNLSPGEIARQAKIPVKKVWGIRYRLKQKGEI